MLPTEERPRLAGGIESAHQRTRAGLAYVVIHNAANHAYLKLDEEEFELLPLMDGEHTVKELVIEYYLRNEVLALPRIAGLVQLLKVHGFLAGGYVDAYDELTSKLHSTSATDVLVRLWRGLLQTSIPIPGLDRFFNWLYRAGGWIFFTRPSAAVGLLLLVAGPAFFLVELASGRYPLFKFGGSYLLGFGLLLLLDVVTISVHEAGHALAMKYAGRFVRRSGVMLYYGMPAAYVDTTDAWMAPRKLRLLVSFAGPWTGVWLGASAPPWRSSCPTARSAPSSSRGLSWPWSTTSSTSARCSSSTGTSCSSTCSRSRCCAPVPSPSFASDSGSVSAGGKG